MAVFLDKKDSVEILDYVYDWSGVFAGRDPNDQILTASVTIINNTGTTPLAINSTEFLGQEVKVFLSGGENGTTYKLDITVTTVGNRCYNDTMYLDVVDI